MTILDAVVPVLCDGPNCYEEVQVEPPYVYHSYSGRSGQYDTDDSTIEELLESAGWVVLNGQHFCCDECAGLNEDDEDE